MVAGRGSKQSAGWESTPPCQKKKQLTAVAIACTPRVPPPTWIASQPLPFLMCGSAPAAASRSATSSQPLPAGQNDLVVVLFCRQQQSGFTPSWSSETSGLGPPRWPPGDGWPSNGGRVPGAQPAAYPCNVCWPSLWTHRRTGAEPCCRCCSARHSRRRQRAAHPQPRCGRLRQWECREGTGLLQQRFTQFSRLHSTRSQAQCLAIHSSANHQPHASHQPHLTQRCAALMSRSGSVHRRRSRQRPALAPRRHARLGRLWVGVRSGGIWSAC